MIPGGKMLVWALTATGIAVMLASFEIGKIGAKMNKSDDAVVVLEKQEDVRIQLTDQDIADKLCEHYLTSGTLQDYVACREYNCWRFSEGTGEATSGASCEEISNIGNTIVMKSTCDPITDDRDRTDCYAIFGQRK